MDFETCSRIKPELSMAPLMDVVLLLLIFFMLTSSMVSIESIDLDLPNSSSAAKVDSDLINISMLADGEFFYNKESINADDLKSKLQKQFKSNPEDAVILSVAEDATAQQMVGAMDLIRNSGGSNISLATKK